MAKTTQILSKKKADSEKEFLSWWIMQFLEKLWKIGKNRNIKLVTTETKRNYLVSEPNYHDRKFFTENLLAIQMKYLNNTWIIPE